MNDSFGAVKKEVVKRLCGKYSDLPQHVAEDAATFATLAVFEKYPTQVCEWCGEISPGGPLEIKILHPECWEAVMNGAGVV